MNNELAEKKYWEESWEKSTKVQMHNETNPFQKHFHAYLHKTNSPKVALEIGCVPGIYLGYLNKTFGYEVEGIDYVKGARTTTLETLQKFGTPSAVIYEDNFFQWEPPKKYDLVCSFGFIEHFIETDCVIERHMRALKSDGILILEVPNFSNGQHLLHYWLDKENLSRHNLSVMNLDFFKKITQKYNLHIECLEYTGGLFDFWWENNNPTFIQKCIQTTLRPIAYLGRKIPINNRFFSPFIILIATSKS